ncbi:MAG: flavodoxin [Saccharofermentans sp.]|nr:flavodoxin [Saccharofermentans sp.]
MRMFKKILSVVLSAVVLGGMAACSNKPVSESSGVSLSAATEQSLITTPRETTEPSDTEKESKWGKAVVVYFSCTGNTKEVALKIASEVGGSTYEIVPVKQYTQDDLSSTNKRARAYREQSDKNARPEIYGTPVDLSSYDTVFIGYPVWFSQAPRILYTFVENHSFEGKTVVPFCTSENSGIGTTATDLAELAENKGKWLTGTRFAASVKSTDIEQWLNALESRLA